MSSIAQQPNCSDNPNGDLTQDQNCSPKSSNSSAVSVIKQETRRNKTSQEQQEQNQQSVSASKSQFCPSLTTQAQSANTSSTQYQLSNQGNKFHGVDTNEADNNKNVRKGSKRRHNREPVESGRLAGGMINTRNSNQAKSKTSPNSAEANQVEGQINGLDNDYEDDFEQDLNFDYETVLSKILNEKKLVSVYRAFHKVAYSTLKRVLISTLKLYPSGTFELSGRNQVPHKYQKQNKAKHSRI